MNDSRVYDMVIIGGGPGGYAAALYAARAGLSALVLEKLAPGGQMALSHQIDNYPGFVEGIDGISLARNMQRQAERFGASTRFAQVLSLELRETPKVIESDAGKFWGRTVVIATGAEPKELGLTKEKELTGRGVSYCAACDGMFCQGKTVVVVGGGNTAAADALLLSRMAKKVVLVHRRDELRATRLYHHALASAKNVELRWNSEVVGLIGDEKVRGVCLRDVNTGKESMLDCSGVFISVGRQPSSQLVADQLELDEGGYIVAGESTTTGIPGVYAVGDVRAKPLRQIATATADGAVAVYQAETYLAEGR